MVDYLEALAGFIVELDLKSIPAETVEQARYTIADTIAAIAAGAAEPEVKALTARRIRDSGACSVIGTGIASTPQRAALLNGTAGTWLEIDEGNRFARGHPAIHVLPAALAFAELHRLSGADLMLATIIGYEVAARLGIASTLRSSMHPHGTWGTIGAAVAVAKLAGLERQGLIEVINVASSLTLATSKKTMLQGGTVRNVYAGIANQNGMLALELVECGFVGELNGLASVFGGVVSEALDREALIDGLGRSWQIDRNYFKRHACCRFNHAALDALEKILADRSLKAAQVERIELVTYRDAAELNSAVPRNVLGAKFSLPFAVATRIVSNSSGISSFTAERVADPAILALAARVVVREDPAMTQRLPHYRPAQVAVHLNDGRVLEAATEINRGDDTSPYSRAELDSKFFELATRVWSPETAQAIHGELMRLEHIEDLSELSRAFDAVQNPLRKVS